MIFFSKYYQKLKKITQFFKSKLPPSEEHTSTQKSRRNMASSVTGSAIIAYNKFIIWLATFASFDWSIPGPITYGTDADGPVTFGFSCLCFICTLFELVIFTNEMANHFGFDKGSFGLEIRLVYDSKKKQKIFTLHQKLTMKIFNNSKS